MQAIFHTSVDELTIGFLENLKKQFRNTRIDIVVKEGDETDYLNSSRKNRELLESAIKEVENHNPISQRKGERLMSNFNVTIARKNDDVN